MRPWLSVGTSLGRSTAHRVLLPEAQGVGSQGGCRPPKMLSWPGLLGGLQGAECSEPLSLLQPGTLGPASGWQSPAAQGGTCCSSLI